MTGGVRNDKSRFHKIKCQLLQAFFIRKQTNIDLYRMPED